MAIKTPTITDLDTTQINVVRHQPYDSSMFVSGPPGSGKTHVAILRLQVMLNNGFSNILLLLYNHSMYGFLRTVFDKMGIRTNVTIDTKDIFLINVARSLGHVLNNRNYTEKYDEALNFLLKNSTNRRYDVIVIDECQDFSDKEMNVLKKMSPKILAVGDMDQTVYKTTPSPFFNTLPSKKLKTIYRFGKKIAHLAENFAASSESLADKVSVSTNTDVFKISATINSDAIKKIARIIQSKKHTNQSVAILTLTNVQITDTHQELLENGITTFSTKNNSEFRDYNFESNIPIIITPFSAKGMEFDVVILYGFDDEILCKSHFVTKKDKVIYVSLTRTSNELYLIEQSNTYAPLKNLQGWITMNTSVKKNLGPLTDGF